MSKEHFSPDLALRVERQEASECRAEDLVDLDCGEELNDDWFLKKNGASSSCQ
jgi:hypothetical protein